MTSGVYLFIRLKAVVSLLAVSLLAAVACDSGSDVTTTPSPSPTSAPTATPPPRSDFPRSAYHDQHEGCKDRGYGGVHGVNGILYYYFIDLPSEPHTPEVIRETIAAHICLAGKPSWVPDKRLGLAQGQFLITELQDWYVEIKHPEVFGDAKWSASSATGGGNKIEISLLNLSDEEGIRSRMEQSGIPQDAVIFRQGEPFFRGGPAIQQ